jgi:hypothetical protein
MRKRTNVDFELLHMLPIFVLILFRVYGCVFILLVSKATPHAGLLLLGRSTCPVSRRRGGEPKSRFPFLCVIIINIITAYWVPCFHASCPFVSAFLMVTGIQMLCWCLVCGNRQDNVYFLGPLCLHVHRDVPVHYNRHISYSLGFWLYSRLRFLHSWCLQVDDALPHVRVCGGPSLRPALDGGQPKMP